MGEQTCLHRPLESYVLSTRDLPLRPLTKRWMPMQGGTTHLVVNAKEGAFNNSIFPYHRFPFIISCLHFRMTFLSKNFARRSNTIMANRIKNLAAESMSEMLLRVATIVDAKETLGERLSFAYFRLSEYPIGGFWSASVSEVSSEGATHLRGSNCPTIAVKV